MSQFIVTSHYGFIYARVRGWSNILCAEIDTACILHKIVALTLALHDAQIIDCRQPTISALMFYILVPSGAVKFNRTDEALLPFSFATWCQCNILFKLTDTNQLHKFWTTIFTWLLQSLYCTAARRLNFFGWTVVSKTKYRNKYLRFFLLVFVWNVEAFRPQCDAIYINEVGMVWLFLFFFLH